MFEADWFSETFRNYHCTLARGCARVPVEIYDHFFTTAAPKPAPHMCQFKYKLKNGNTFEIEFDTTQRI